MFSKAEKVADALVLIPGSLRGAGSAADARSIISADMTVVGKLQSAGDIRVNGTVEGDIISRTVSVGEGARIEGSIYAESVHISGQVSGRVEATSVTIARSAHVVCNITHHTLSIEPGAVVEGRRPWRPLSFMVKHRRW